MLPLSTCLNFYSTPRDRLFPCWSFQMEGYLGIALLLPGITFFASSDSGGELLRYVDENSPQYPPGNWYRSRVLTPCRLALSKQGFSGLSWEIWGRSCPKCLFVRLASCSPVVELVLGSEACFLWGESFLRDSENIFYIWLARSFFCLKNVYSGFPGETVVNYYLHHPFFQTLLYPLLQKHAIKSSLAHSACSSVPGD